MKNFNDQNKPLITIRSLHFNKKNKKISGKVFLDPSMRTDEDESGAQNFVDIMVKIHNKIQNIKSLAPAEDPSVPC